MNRTEFQMYAPLGLQSRWLTDLLREGVEFAAMEHLLAEGFMVHAALDVTPDVLHTQAVRSYGLTVTGPDDLAVDVHVHVRMRWDEDPLVQGCSMGLCARIYSHELQSDGEFLERPVFAAPLYLAGNVSFERADRTLKAVIESKLGANLASELAVLTKELCGQAMVKLAH